MKIRDALKRNYNLRQFHLEVNIEDVGSFDENLADKLYKQPSEHLAIFEEAAKEVADELTAPRPEEEEELQDVQVILSSDSNPSKLRDLKVLLVATRLSSCFTVHFLFLVRNGVEVSKSSWDHCERFRY